VDLYELIEASALKKVRDFHFKIYGSDKDARVLERAEENIKSANLEEFISIKEQDFFESKKETGRQLFMVFNPPYDERLSANIEELYSSIGNTLKRGYSNTQAWMITSSMEALKHVGLRPSRKIKLYNGKLESRFVKYEMYEGSRKAKKQGREFKEEE
jgi:putative N6-adenine-specific DNA methylase